MNIQINPVPKARQAYIDGQAARLAADIRRMTAAIKKATPPLQAGAGK